MNYLDKTQNLRKLFMGYLYPEFETRWRNCCKCERRALIEEQNRFYCADCYSLKIWNKKLENVGKYLDQKENKND